MNQPHKEECHQDQLDAEQSDEEPAIQGELDPYQMCQEYLGNYYLNHENMSLIKKENPKIKKDSENKDVSEIESLTS